MSRYTIAFLVIVTGLLAAACSSQSDGGARRAGDGILPRSLVDQSDARSAAQFKLPGERVYVELNMLERGQRLGLVNAGSTKPADVYSKFASEDLALKVSNDIEMGKLLEALRLLDFYQLTEPARPTGTVTWTLAVDVDGGKSTVYYVRGRAAQRQEKLRDLQMLFMEGFNRTLALQSVDPRKGGKGLFVSEQSRVNQENTKTLQKTSKDK